MQQSLRRVLTAFTFFFGLSFFIPDSANATTIDFATLGGSNGDPFSSYTQFGFTVTGQGDWRVGQLGGNPAPSVFCPDCSLGGLTVTGGVFTFGFIDIAPVNFSLTPISYRILGVVNGVQLYSQSGTVAFGTFSRIASVEPATLILELLIGIGTSGNSANVDNICLNTCTATLPEVPLPAALPLFATALGALGLLGWRRKRKAQATA